MLVEQWTKRELATTPFAPARRDLLTWGGTALADLDVRFARQVAESITRDSALDPEEQRTWLEENLVDLRVGKLTLEDLP